MDASNPAPSAPDQAARRWLASTADAAALVEARGLALRGARVRAVGASAVVHAPVHDLAVLVGPPVAALVEFVAGLGVGELHASGEEFGAWQDELGLGPPVLAPLQQRAAEDVGSLDALVDHPVAAVRGPDDSVLGGLPRSLVRELAAIRPTPRAFVALAGDAAVALAYAFVETEGWIDVSVDTVREFRGMGFARSAAAALVADGARAGRAALWGAEPDNAPSLALARRLGFTPAGVCALMAP